MMAGEESFLKGSRCFFIKFRGTKKEQIFKKEADYKFYLYLLKRYKARFRVNIFGFCLIPESASMVIQPYDDELLPVFMHQVSDEYVSYFNDKYTDTPPVKASVYRKMVIEEDRVLFSCLKYIEFLPVKEQLSELPWEYAYSSCCHRVEGRNSGLMDQQVFLKAGS